jgi:Xaa-Pro aminopeptidase
MSYESRIDAVRAGLGELEVDALLVTNITNVRYLTGFSGTNGQVLVSAAGAVFLTDPRYAARAADIVRGAEVVIYPVALTEVLGARVAEMGAHRVGIEADTMTITDLDRLSTKLDATELVTTSKVVESLRRRKDAHEVKLVKDAVRVTDEAFEWVLDGLTPGRTEREIALDLEVHMRSSGGDAVSFEPIVGSGPLSAHIHHRPSDRELGKGDLVLLDFGCTVDGYSSDLTRTVVLGAATEEQRAVYDVVHEAQTRAITAVRGGAGCSEVDGVARAFIADEGHGDAFGHGLGHGVGLDIHEAPRLHKTSEDELVAGDVVTIEPGIYDVGWGGIRIEDCVLVTDEGSQVLGSARRSELIEL